MTTTPPLIVLFVGNPRSGKSYTVDRLEQRSNTTTTTLYGSTQVAHHHTTASGDYCIICNNWVDSTLDPDMVVVFSGGVLGFTAAEWQAQAQQAYPGAPVYVMDSDNLGILSLLP